MIKIIQLACSFVGSDGCRRDAIRRWFLIPYLVYRFLFVTVTVVTTVSVVSVSAAAAEPDFLKVNDTTLVAGHPSLARWHFPTEIKYPANNKPTPDRIALGQRLFFDTSLSLDSSTSCASCHQPVLGWSDGLSTAKGLNGKILRRATPSLVNAAYGTIFMWDGSAESLEEQAMLPIFNSDEMGLSLSEVIERVSDSEDYLLAFSNAYGDEGVNKSTLSRALAAFQRTIISRTSRFDAWVAGDSSALSKQEIDGFAIFLNPEQGNCATCHAGANFTDDSFHNIGLGSFADPEPDLGRYIQKPVNLMKGAFKTPTLREISLTAPYFHDGSAKTLEGVIDLYVKGGESQDNLSPEMKAIELSDQEKKNLIAFLHTLTSLKLSNAKNTTAGNQQSENIYE